MKKEPELQVEIRDVTTGLWIWRLKNPFWEPGLDWEPLTASTCVESGGETLVLDPQIPPHEAVEVWQRFAARPPTWWLFSSRITFGTLICSCAVTMPEHSVRDSSFVTMFPRPRWNQLNLQPTSGRDRRPVRRAWRVRNPALVARATGSGFRRRSHGTRRRVACLGDAVAFRARPAGIARAA